MRTITKISAKKSRNDFYFKDITANENAPVIPMTTQQFIDLGKIPDFVRDVKPFTGDPTRLVDWLSDVDAILRTYRENGATQTQIHVLERTVVAIINHSPSPNGRHVEAKCSSSYKLFQRKSIGHLY